CQADSYTTVCLFQTEVSIVWFVASPKVKMINVRLTPATHDQFKIACELRGSSMSSLMHQFVIRTIREEKERDPQAFDVSNKPAPVVAHIGPAATPGEDKESIRKKYIEQAGGVPLAAHSKKKIPFIGNKEQQGQRRKKIK